MLKTSMLADLNHGRHSGFRLISQASSTITCMKTIIVPTDYSETSRNALEYAAELAKVTRGSILLYHAFTVPMTYTEIPAPLLPLDKLTRDHLASLETLAGEIRSTYGVPVECHASGVPVNLELPDLVQEKHAGLVVMGRRSAQDWEHKLFGSTVASVVRHATYPVLIVPNEVSFSKPVHMLFACDYQSLTAHTPLQTLKELAEAFGAIIRVLHVEKPESVAGGGLAVAAKSSGKVSLETIFHGVKHHYSYLEHEHILDGITQGIAEYQADWLVMAPQPHGFWDAVMNKSNTRKMALTTYIPLLVLPTESR
jgi:nucleotide-binding universal stress UspA family protein